MSTKIFDAALTTSFVASKPLLMVGGAANVSLDFLFEIITAATGVLWFLEYTDADPNVAATQWFREVAEEDNGGGAVDMPVVERRFRANGGADLAVDDHALSVQFVRKHLYYRVQLAIAAGGGAVTRMRVFAQFGGAANSPST